MNWDVSHMFLLLCIWISLCVYKSLIVFKSFGALFVLKTQQENVYCFTRCYFFVLHVSDAFLICTLWRSASNSQDSRNQNPSPPPVQWVCFIPQKLRSHGRFRKYIRARLSIPHWHNERNVLPVVQRDTTKQVVTLKVITVESR